MLIRLVSADGLTADLHVPDSHARDRTYRLNTLRPSAADFDLRAPVEEFVHVQHRTYSRGRRAEDGVPEFHECLVPDDPTIVKTLVSRNLFESMEGEREARRTAEVRAEFDRWRAEAALLHITITKEHATRLEAENRRLRQLIVDSQVQLNLRSAEMQRAISTTLDEIRVGMRPDV